MLREGLMVHYGIVVFILGCSTHEFISTIDLKKKKERKRATNFLSFRGHNHSMQTTNHKLSTTNNKNQPSINSNKKWKPQANSTTTPQSVQMTQVQWSFEQILQFLEFNYKFTWIKYKSIQLIISLYTSIIHQSSNSWKIKQQSKAYLF